VSALYKNSRVKRNNDSPTRSNLAVPFYRLAALHAFGRRAENWTAFPKSGAKKGETCQKLDRLPNSWFRFFLFPVTRAGDVEGTDHRVSRIISAEEEVSYVAGVQGLGC